MKKIKDLECFAEKLKLIGEIVGKTQAVHSPKIQNVLKGLQSIDKAHQVMKQAQQVQELMHTGQNDRLDQKTIESALPLLLLLFNNFSTTENTD